MNTMPLAKGKDITLKTVTNDGKQEWLFSNKLHELGGDRQREVRKTFASRDEAKALFDEQAAKFHKMFRNYANSSIKQDEAELLIHIDGVQIVEMTFQAVSLLCA